MRRSAVRRALLATLAATAVLASVALGTGSAEASHFVPFPVGSDDYVGAQRYAGDFPDPSVLKVDSTYYAYSTTIANKNLPVLTSKDLKTWTAIPGRNGSPWDNDALRLAPTWTDYKYVDSRRVAPTWAPTVRPAVGGDYVHAYATRLRGTSKFCISVSRSTSPTSGFVDSSRGPLECPADEGAIDPFLWKVDGKLFLLFKTEGIRGQRPTRIFIRRMVPDGSRFATGSHSHELLRTRSNSWEGNVIENPAMIRYQGVYYLLYSGNDWATDKYAVGYAICQGPMGPCERPSSSPLLASVGSIAGPGGESPFVDTAGNLRMAYHAWTTGYVGYPTSDSCRRSGACPQRRLKVARLAVAPDQTLRVTETTVP